MLAPSVQSTTLASSNFNLQYLPTQYSISKDEGNSRREYTTHTKWSWCVSIRSCLWPRADRVVESTDIFRLQTYVHAATAANHLLSCRGTVFVYSRSTSRAMLGCDWFAPSICNRNIRFDWLSRQPWFGSLLHVIFNCRCNAGFLQPKNEQTTGNRTSCRADLDSSSAVLALSMRGGIMMESNHSWRSLFIADHAGSTWNENEREFYRLAWRPLMLLFSLATPIYLACASFQCFPRR